MATNVAAIEWSDVGVLAFILLKAATGRIREVPWLLNVVGFCFLVYFLLDPIEQALGVK